MKEGECNVPEIHLREWKKYSLQRERNTLNETREILFPGSGGRVERKKAEVTFPEWSEARS